MLLSCQLLRFQILPPLLCVAVRRCHLVGLRFVDGHRAILQERGDECAIYLQPPVVVDQALPLKLVHEFTYPRARGTHHLRQR